MKKMSHLAIVFIAFVFGQGIQLFVGAVAYNLYANRPVMWHVIAAGISILMVVLAYILIRMDSEEPGGHIAQYSSFAAGDPHRPPLDTDPEPIEFDE